MASVKKILIIQSFNPNKGDNSVISVMLSSLHRYHYKIAITAFDPNKAKVEHNVDAYNYLLNLKNMKLAQNKLQFYKFLMLEFSWLIYSLLYLIFHKINIDLPLPKTKKAIVKVYQSADIVILPGGHFFTSFNSPINNFSHYYALRFAQILGKKTMVYSQTIGPYTNNLSGKIERLMANRVLSKTTLVTVRDKNSLNSYCGSNVVETAETVFMEPVKKININPQDYIRYYNGEFVVGVTIHHLYFKHYFSRSEYVNLMVDIFNSIIKEYHVQILMIPMEDNYNTGGDRPIICDMIAQLPIQNRKYIQMVSDDLTSDQTANLISRCDLFVGTKTHSIVYALKTATPTLSISYQQKSTDFMNLFGVGQYAIDMKDLEKQRFMQIFSYLFSERERVKSELSAKYPNVQKHAELNNVLLSKLLDDK